MKHGLERLDVVDGDGLMRGAFAIVTRKWRWFEKTASYVQMFRRRIAN